MKHPENIKTLATHWKCVTIWSWRKCERGELMRMGGTRVALNTCAAARKVTKVWKGRIDGDGSVLGGSRAALIQNDGTPLAVRIAALKYPRYQKHPKAPTITFYPQNWLHSALLKQHKSGFHWIWKEIWSAWKRERGLTLVRFPSPGMSSINCSQLQCW